MPLVPENTASLRQPAPEEQPLPAHDVHVSVDGGDEGDEPADQPQYDHNGNIVKIKHADGTVTVSLDGQPIERARVPDKPGGWFENLAEKIDPMELQRISGDLFRDIDNDIESRKDWVEDRAIGLKLLGLKIELPSSQGASEGAPVEGMSRVRHPLLLEAVLRFQANARAELLPADGPVKVRDDSNGTALEQDETANALERDMNHYLTSTATEYYPDTDRMLLMLGFGGTGFKKVYFCPLRQRPVSESVDADDLIVNSNVIEINNAKRITHKTMMRQSTVTRMQILGHYRDIDLSTPSAPTLDSAQRAKLEQQGIRPDDSNPDDRDREVYETLAELDIKGLEHRWKGKVTGLKIPYRVTMDVTTKEILAIVRNYDRHAEQLPDARRVYVKYTFVPGLGFYDIGLLHILGNTTNAVSAAWRELLDAGMFASFPGFLVAQNGMRQNTSIFRVPPGGGAPVQTNGMKINEAIMPLPYKEPSNALMMLVKDMAETGQRVGGTSELQVGEGRAETPVGTMLTMVEQAQKILNSVHKRLHQAQSEEFALLKECFKDHPESFWQRNKRPTLPWDQDLFLKALDNCNLVPQADPNTASHAQRLMKVGALVQMSTAQPQLFDPIAVTKAAVKAIGWNNPEQFMAPASAMGKPTPQMEKDKAETAVKQQDAQSRAKSADAKVAETQAKIQGGFFLKEKDEDGGDQSGLGAATMIKAKASLMDAETRAKELPFKTHDAIMRHRDLDVEDENRDLDRESRERVAVLGLAKDIISHQNTSGHELNMQALDHAQERHIQRNEPKPAAPKS